MFINKYINSNSINGVRGVLEKTHTRAGKRMCSHIFGF